MRKLSNEHPAEVCVEVIPDYIQKKKRTISMKEQIKPVPSEPVRLNKYLSDAGVCSRRQADRYVEAGRITVDGEAAVMGQKVLPSQIICLDGKEISVSRKRVVLAVNKPRGIVCTTEKREKDNVLEKET